MQNMYFCTKAYIDYCHTQTKTQHICLIKCNESVHDVNICLDHGLYDGSQTVRDLAACYTQSRADRPLTVIRRLACQIWAVG